ncbi:MAG: NAD(P)H-dependent oxidoreductase [Proteobacteria bacterium]|nr:NAD(P)H-dependent oxidoreductase [Pseudomonadota bacterium]
MNILIINGHIRWARISAGRLNRSINRVAANLAMKHGHTLKYCNADRFYSPLTEVEKFLWADRLIIHFPVNWFGLPGKFKTYLDTVFIAGEGYLYQGGRENGRTCGSAGLLHGKPYLLITTWSASSSCFNDPLSFFEGASPDSVINGVHFMFKFLGMRNESTLHMLDVNKSKRIADDLELCKKKLNEFLTERNVFS